MIKQDQEILRGIPQEQAARRAELQHTIDVRIDDLIHAIHRGRSLREGVSGYKGNWRDVVLFVCVVLFAVIWWNVPHSKRNWLPTFIVLILVAAITAGYAMRGMIRSLPDHAPPQSSPLAPTSSGRRSGLSRRGPHDSRCGGVNVSARVISGEPFTVDAGFAPARRR